ncbi:hypothetical protein V8G54_030806 [Vigna mungo]|uniref:Integrase catalytic domain-containing protein n=1 Tax=Vigna mungo TaxID=3915 RepID=A0AAQ3MXF3_VIGMU
MTEANSYLYLHPSENPAIALVSPVLDDANYHSWSRSMLTALSAKNKIEFVLDNLRPPATDKPEHAAWIRGNNMVVSWLVHSVSTNIRQSIIWMNKASEIWVDLKNKFSQGSLSRISSLQHDIATLHQGDLTTSEYFTKLRILGDEIENFRSEPACTCKPDCDCQVLKILKQRKQEDQVMHSPMLLLMCSLLLDPLPDITKVFSLVAQQERQFSSGSLVAATKIQDNNNSNNVTASTSFTACNYCGKYGHSEAVCYRKNGFPNQDRSSKNIQNNRRHCTHCNKSGHTVEVCYKKHGYPPGRKLHNKSAQIHQISFQILANIFKNHNLNDSSTSAQVHHIGSVSANQAFSGNICPTLTSKSFKNKWILDSGATDHISVSLKSFSFYKKIKPIQIALPNGTIVSSEYSGTVNLNRKIQLFDDLQTKEKISIIKLTGGLYVSDFSSNLPTVCSVNNTVNDTGLWHLRLGHPFDIRLHTLKLKYPFIVHHPTYMCDTCHRAKQKKLPFHDSNSNTMNIFYLIHVDIWGPCNIVSMRGFKYFLTIVDDFSRYTWLIPMPNKSVVRKTIIDFITNVENQFSTTVKTIRTDTMHNFFSFKGINHQTTCNETPQQNGIVERKHQHFLNVTRSLLSQANLPIIFWCFAAEYATLLINCMPTPLLNNATPYEKLNGKLYDISVLHVFGCLCYVSTLAANRKKLDARVVPGVFLGFKQHTKGYQFLNLQSHKIDISCNVLFHEDCFPYTSSHNNIHDSYSLSLPIPHNYHHDYDNVNFPNNRILVPTPNDPVITTNEDNVELQQTADPY